MTDVLITIGRYFWLHEALVARSVLDAEEIPSWLQDSNLVRLDWMYANAIHGIKLQVPTEFADEARAVLSDASRVFDDMPASEPCSHGGSKEFALIHRSRLATVMTWLVIGIPLWYRRSIWKCSECGQAVASRSVRDSMRAG